MERREYPIGFFDSGVGGLSVLKHAIQMLPNESFIYYGDNANAPYGEKSEEQIQTLSMACGEFLYKKGVKALVMACNTATSAAVQRMRARYNLPVISIEPAVKPAFAAARSGRIVVMATPATLAQQRYHALVERVGCADRLINLPCAGLVELIETGELGDPRIEEYLRRRFQPLAGQLVDGIVMGCTHYSFIAAQIRNIAQEYVQGEAQIFDGMFGMVRHLGEVLRHEHLDAPGPARPVQLYSSANGAVLEVFRKLLEV